MTTEVWLCLKSMFQIRMILSDDVFHDIMVFSLEVVKEGDVKEELGLGAGRI